MSLAFHENLRLVMYDMYRMLSLKLSAEISHANFWFFSSSSPKVVGWYFRIGNTLNESNFKRYPCTRPQCTPTFHILGYFMRFFLCGIHKDSLKNAFHLELTFHSVQVLRPFFSSYFYFSLVLLVITKKLNIFFWKI